MSHPWIGGGCLHSLLGSCEMVLKSCRDLWCRRQSLSCSGGVRWKMDLVSYSVMAEWPGTVRSLPDRCLFLGLDMSRVSSFSRYSDSW